MTQFLKCVCNFHKSYREFTMLDLLHTYLLHDQYRHYKELYTNGWSTFGAQKRNGLQEQDKRIKD